MNILRFTLSLLLVCIFVTSLTSAEIEEFNSNKYTVKINTDARGLIISEEQKATDLIYTLNGQKFTSGSAFKSSFVVNIDELSLKDEFKGDYKLPLAISSNPYALIVYSKAVAQKFGQVTVVPFFVIDQRAKVARLLSENDAGNNYPIIKNIHFIMSYFDRENLLIYYVMENEDGSKRIDMSELVKHEDYWSLSISVINKKRPLVMNITNAIYEEFLTGNERISIN